MVYLLLPMPREPCTKLCRPLIFFYDKPHVCSTTHYRNTIFGPGFWTNKLASLRHQVATYSQRICAIMMNDVESHSGSPVQKGDFIEETLGVAEREDILRNGAWMAALCRVGARVH